jgi:hypothetical protein
VRREGEAERGGLAVADGERREEEQLGGGGQKERKSETGFGDVTLFGHRRVYKIAVPYSCRSRTKYRGGVDDQIRNFAFKTLVNDSSSTIAMASSSPEPATWGQIR